MDSTAPVRGELRVRLYHERLAIPVQSELVREQPPTADLGILKEERRACLRAVSSHRVSPTYRRNDGELLHHALVVMRLVVVRVVAHETDQ